MLTRLIDPLVDCVFKAILGVEAASLLPPLHSASTAASSIPGCIRFRQPATSSSSRSSGSATGQIATDIAAPAAGAGSRLRR